MARLLCLAVLSLLVALTGLAEEIGMEGGGRILAYTVLALIPARSDALVRRLLLGESDGDTGEVALALGLLSGMIAVTSVRAQIERAPTGCTAFPAAGPRSPGTRGPWR